jgi:hypothetical protein
LKDGRLKRFGFTTEHYKAISRQIVETIESCRHGADLPDWAIPVIDLDKEEYEKAHEKESGDAGANPSFDIETVEALD